MRFWLKREAAAPYTVGCPVILTSFVICRVLILHIEQRMEALASVCRLEQCEPQMVQRVERVLAAEAVGQCRTSIDTFATPEV